MNSDFLQQSNNTGITPVQLFVYNIFMLPYEEFIFRGCLLLQ